MARRCTPRPETTRSKPRCSRQHRIWNTSSRPANSGAWNGAKANCNSAPFPAGGPMFRPVAGLEGQDSLKLMRQAIIQLIKQAWLLLRSVAIAVKQRRRQTVLNELEAERLDRIRNPWKYLGK